MLEKYMDVIDSVNKNFRLITEHSEVFPTYVEAMINEDLVEKSVYIVKENLNKIKMVDKMDLIEEYAETGNIDNALEICNYWYETADVKEPPLTARIVGLFVAGKWNKAFEESRSLYDKIGPELNVNLRGYVAKEL
ncbi:hypothetical protein OXIME_000291 [Oxyplasma meridianum]|uniref:Uncharacterized protein n=1 Tax=Oxyplasma meridianum TaxID=3073602 RepID=A0AAX4NEY3_9ARCH